MEISNRRSNLAQTALVSALGLAALSLLGLVLAYWTWAWLGPRPAPRLESSAESPGPIAAAGDLFGRAPPRDGGDAQTGLSIRLLGVVAATAGRPGYAVMQLDAKQSLAVREGEIVTPGVRLDKVYPDHVTLERSGTRETLAWPARGKAALSPVPGTRK